jgi:hypothetical protein
MGHVKAIGAEAIGLGLATEEISKGRHCECTANWLQEERTKREGKVTRKPKVREPPKEKRDQLETF